MNKKKTIYIAGPIEGVPNYWEAFEEAEERLTGHGIVVLLPSRLPSGMTKEQYMRICFAMIDSADFVLLLPGWRKSKGATLEASYCQYIGKPCIESESLWDVIKNTSKVLIDVLKQVKDIYEEIGEEVTRK